MSTPTTLTTQPHAKLHAPLDAGEKLSLIRTLIAARRDLKKIGAPHADRIDSSTSRRELATLYKLAASCPLGALVLEIGSYHGKSSCYLAAGLVGNNGTLLCVDTWRNEFMMGGTQDTWDAFRKNTAAIRAIHPVRKRSDALEAGDVPGPVALAFIDGDHSYHGTKTDLGVVERYLARDGRIVFHDTTNFAGVSRVIGEALAGGKWMLGGFVGTLLWLQRADFLPDL